MSVVILPVRHLGGRQPTAMVVSLPEISLKTRKLIVSGVDEDTRAAVLAEISILETAIDAAVESGERLVELLQPYTAGDVA